MAQRGGMLLRPVALRRRHEMNVGQICKRHIVSIDGAGSLQQAAQLMREHHVGALVVTTADAQGTHVAGVVTDRDMAIEALARGPDASQLPVARIARERLVSVPETAGLDEAVARLQDAGVRRLLVQGAEGQLVGLVSFDDLLQACVAPLAGLSEVLRREVEREVAERGAAAAPSRPLLRVPAMGTAGWTTGR
jgi:CBS-domain-containing membrane protein